MIGMKGMYYMDIFNILSLVGGLCIFLFGMNVMGQALERRAGGKLRSLLEKLTTNRIAGLLTGLGITAVIQSSSAATVMVVGFVNSGLMTLKQAINVIMGANVGTTVTAWILSLNGIDSSGNIILKLLKPSAFTPVLALIGIIFYMFCKDSKKKDTGVILLGFATLMFGMETMSESVSGLKDVPQFRQLFTLFQNPVLGVLAGAILTAVIQSSSASVGILQALSTTGEVSYGAAVPIIMGQNIGTCITAMLSSVGANKNAKRAALVHLLFNIIGTSVWLTVYCIIKAIFKPIILEKAVSYFEISLTHSLFNILCLLLLLPLSGVLEKLVLKIIPETQKKEYVAELDERLFATPSLALERCRKLTEEMATISVESLKDGLKSLSAYTPELAEKIREAEDRTDHFEDILGTYLVKLSSRQISEADSIESAQLLKLIGDYERIADHSVNLLESAEEMYQKEIKFTKLAYNEIKVISSAVSDILDLSLNAFVNNDLSAAFDVEPLEQVIDKLRDKLRNNHISRLQGGNCSIEAGFVWSDLLTNLERTSDHCSNIAGCIIDVSNHNMNIHESLRKMRDEDSGYRNKFNELIKKYAL